MGVDIYLSSLWETATRLLPKHQRAAWNVWETRRRAAARD